MPQIQLSQNKGVITWDHSDWLSGANTFPNISISEFLGGSLVNPTNINPYNDFGVLQPGFLAEDVTNVSVATAALLNGVVHNGKAYAISSDALLHEITVTTGALTTPTTFPHTITGATTGQDIITYYIGATKYVFYSWKDGSNGNIGRYDLSTTFDDDYMSTVPAGAAAMDTNDDHPLIVGDDDILYVGDGNNVHAFDGQTGANGTLSKNVLTLPKGYVVTSFAKFNNQTLVVFAYKTTNSTAGFYQSEAKAFFWNYLDLDPYRTIDIDDYYVSGGFNWKGTIGCFTDGNRDTLVGGKVRKLKLFNGGVFETLVEFTDSLPVNGGIETYANHIAWNSGGKLYTYGNVFKGLDNVTNIISSGSGSTSGMYKTFASGVQLISSGATTSGGLQKFDVGKYVAAASTYIKNSYPSLNGKAGKLTKIEVDWYWASTGGRSITLSVLADNVNSDEVVFGETETSYSTVGRYFNKNNGDALPIFNKSLGLLIYWDTGSGSTSTPKIKSIKAEFDIINL